MAGEPQHAAAETPVARPARHDDGVELVLAHLGAQRGIAARVFLLGELLVDGVAVVRRLAHVGEWQRLIELAAHHLPRLWTNAGRLDVDVHGVLISSVTELIPPHPEEPRTARRL